MLTSLMVVLDFIGDGPSHRWWFFVGPINWREPPGPNDKQITLT